MIKKGAIIVSTLAIMVSLLCNDAIATEPEIYISSKIIHQGDLSLIRIRTDNDETIQVKWREKEIFLNANTDKNIWQGFLAVDMEEKPGRYMASVNIPTSGYEKEFEIEVVDKDYGVRRLTLPTEMVDLDAETLERVREESKVMSSLWEAPATSIDWSGPFLRPVDGDVVGPFGRRSIINDQPRSPHTGVDLRGEQGTPVKSINNGIVVLTSDHFFTGKTVVLDHGGEIMSMYFHLDEIQVKQGDSISKGQIIGLVGSTGRVTGPHLHWGLRINGARVNPLSIIDLSWELEE